MIKTLFVGAAMNSKQAMFRPGEAKKRDTERLEPANGAEMPAAGSPAGVSAVAVDSAGIKAPAVQTGESPDEGAVLLERAQAGDMSAYGELVRRYQARVLTVAYGILRNREDAEDVVQDGFLKAYRNLNNFRGQSSFYTWLYRIVFNLSIDLSRKKYRRTETNAGDSLQVDAQIAKDAQQAGGQGSAGDIIIGKMAGPDEELSRGELRVKIHQAMDSLSEDHRAVIMLREIDGLSYAEIADAVGCTKGTVMSRLHHARRRLQRILAEFAPAGADNASGDRPKGEEAAADEPRPHGEERQA